MIYRYLRVFSCFFPFKIIKSFTFHMEQLIMGVLNTNFNVRPGLWDTRPPPSLFEDVCVVFFSKSRDHSIIAYGNKFRRVKTKSILVLMVVRMVFDAEGIRDGALRC